MVQIGQQQRPDGGRLRDFRRIPAFLIFLASAFVLALFYFWLLWMMLGNVKPQIVDRNDANSQTFQLDGRPNANLDVKSKRKDAVTIGYAVSVTGCGSDPITEGGAVLKHSVHVTSIHGTMGGNYDYKFYAIYHPDAEECALTLKGLGYEMVKRNTPVAIEDIKGDFLRTRIHRNGCCGEKELIKLEAYTLTDHPIVVHLDLDVLILKPMDAIFDLMLADNPSAIDLSNVPIMWPDRPLPSKINAVFTRDCEFYTLTGMNGLDIFANKSLNFLHIAHRQYGPSRSKVQTGARWVYCFAT